MLRLGSQVILSVSLVLVANSTGAFAQANDVAMALCRSIKDSLQRLTCYDNLPMKGVAPSAAVTPEPVNTEWQIKESKSPIDDSPQFDAMLMGDNDTGALIIRCKENKTEVAVLSKEYIGVTSDTVRTQYRINSGPVREVRWSGSTSGRGAFAPSAIPFIRELPNDGSLFVRLFDYRGAPKDVMIKLVGVEAIRNRVAETCKWPAASKK